MNLFILPNNFVKLTNIKNKKYNVIYQLIRTITIKYKWKIKVEIPAISLPFSSNNKIAACFRKGINYKDDSPSTHIMPCSLLNKSSDHKIPGFVKEKIKQRAYRGIARNYHITVPIIDSQTRLVKMRSKHNICTTLNKEKGVDFTQT